MHNLIPNVWNKYKVEVVIFIVSAFFSVSTGILIEVFFSSGDLYLTGLYSFGFAVVFLLVALMFNQKRVFDKKFALVSQVLIDHFGHASHDNQFFRRRNHYTGEKELLAKVLVNTVLPEMVKRICAENQNMTRLNIIIDSGTTLTPVFPELVLSGIPIKKELFRIYTNCLSGIEEIHRMDNSRLHALTERDFNLIGGQPLSKYRATTGTETDKFLKRFWEENKDNPQVVTLAILTANWFLAGYGFDQLSICARGPGHIEFKSSVCANSQYTILLTPLGKILQMSHVKELNELLKGSDDDAYMSSSIPDKQKDRTFLLTTHRGPESLSPFHQSTIRLKNIVRNNGGKNYIMLGACPNYNPPGTTIREVYYNETPHLYIRDNFITAYGFNPKVDL